MILATERILVVRPPSFLEGMGMPLRRCCLSAVEVVVVVVDDDDDDDEADDVVDDAVSVDDVVMDGNDSAFPC
jgi:predicted site-specific integrase-resolvase